VRARDVPLLPGAANLARQGFIPGGTGRNIEDARDDARFDDAVPDLIRTLLCDAQTSGGLLICVRPENLGVLLDALAAEATPAAAVIGEVIEGMPGRIEID
jgi:selenide,water dikinase